MLLYLLSALVMGGAGSLHCIGMCGPLALSLPVSKHNAMARFAGSLLYNLGRVVTYGSIGAVLGMLGSSFKLMGMQQALSIVLGILILLYLALPKFFLSGKADVGIQKWFAWIRQKLSALFKQQNYSSLFFVGILNGLLPCGLVYMAATVAIASASPIYSALFMMAFGLGTLPLMWSISFFGSFISVNTRATIRRAYPFMMALVACLLIIRGLGLGIPYLSPAPAASMATAAEQCMPIK